MHHTVANDCNFNVTFAGKCIVERGEALGLRAQIDVVLTRKAEPPICLGKEHHVGNRPGKALELLGI